jgi:hypothetical protein
MEKYYKIKCNLSQTYGDNDDWQKFNIHCRKNSFTYPVLCEQEKKRSIIGILKSTICCSTNTTHTENYVEARKTQR